MLSMRDSAACSVDSLHDGIDFQYSLSRFVDFYVSVSIGHVVLR